jgi:hypothetical protein
MRKIILMSFTLAIINNAFLVNSTSFAVEKQRNHKINPEDIKMAKQAIKDETEELIRNKKIELQNAQSEIKELRKIEKEINNKINLLKENIVTNNILLDGSPERDRLLDNKNYEITNGYKAMIGKLKLDLTALLGENTKIEETMEKLLEKEKNLQSEIKKLSHQKKELFVFNIANEYQSIIPALQRYWEIYSKTPNKKFMLNDDNNISIEENGKNRNFIIKSSEKGIEKIINSKIQELKDTVDEGKIEKDNALGIQQINNTMNQAPHQGYFNEEENIDSDSDEIPSDEEGDIGRFN